jgi:hypothetical protein
MQTAAVRVHGHDGGKVLGAEAPRAFDEPLLRLIRKKRPPFAPKLLRCHSAAGFLRKTTRQFHSLSLGDLQFVLRRLLVRIGDR